MGIKELMILGKKPSLDSSPEKRKAAQEKAMDAALKIQEEGCVLLKNKDGLLPLKTDCVNVFGVGAAKPFLTGGGSGQGNIDNAVGFFQALSDEGITYNKELYNLFKNWSAHKKVSTENCPSEGQRKKRGGSPVLNFGIDAVTSMIGDSNPDEIPEAAISNEMLGRALCFSDTAIIFISRNGTEQSDIKPQALRLTEKERSLVKRVCGAFDDVVIILNTANVFELDFAEQYPSVKAVLLIGLPGIFGMTAVAKILKGDISPSGRLSDTYYYNIFDCPSVCNTGSFTYSNCKRKFLLYKEDIYVGYRYAETFLDEALYKRIVQYPFGFGLSYVDFEWKGMKVSASADAITVSVSVKNKSDIPSKDVVQIYVRPPYLGTVEKPAKMLVGFAKTGLLSKGRSETVKIDIPLRLLASFNPGAGCWVMDPGDYIIEVARDSHSPILSEPYTAKEAIVFDRDEVTGNKIERRWKGLEGRFTRLSRKNPQLTLPTEPNEAERIAPLEILNFGKYPPEHVGGKNPAQGVLGSTVLTDLQGKAINDPLWESFLNRFTVDEMTELVCYGGFQTIGIERLGLPHTACMDGPSAVKDPGMASPGVTYPSETVLACTWSTALAAAKGAAAAAEARTNGVNIWYAPATNIHRSPLGGRNFEYLSEDPILSGKMTAAQTKAALEGGLPATVKHFALNDQEKNRMGVHTWCSEQAAREIYLRPFEMAVKEGHAVALMSALNCIGPKWAGESKELLTDILRTEWGFNGCVVTDFAAGNYQHSDTGILAGNDLWLCVVRNQHYVNEIKKAYKNDPAGITVALRGAVKGICVMILHSNKMIPED